MLIKEKNVTDGIGCYVPGESSLINDNSKIVIKNNSIVIKLIITFAKKNSGRISSDKEL